MRYLKRFTQEMSDALVAFGLKSCPICDGTALTVHRRPTMVPVGGVHFEKDDPRHGP